MAFHLGKPILVMFVCAVASGVTSRLTQRSDARADLEVWAFSDQNYKSAINPPKPPDTESLRDFAAHSLGRSVDIKLIASRALDTRLSSLFRSNARGPDVPDVVDIEIGSVGRYFRPPVDEVGLLPLNELLARHGWTGKIVETRFAPWSKDGVIFGVPQDVHPVTIAYDDVAFREAGVDLSTSTTWEQFIDNGLKYQTYYNKPGLKPRWAFEMGEANASTLINMLLQRGVNLVDQQQNVHLTDAKTIDTLVKYVGMLVGPRRIGGPTGLGNEAFSQDLNSHYIASFFCADWRVKYLKDSAPGEFEGRIRLMPLPAWPDSPYRTSTSGGSMAGIPRNAKDSEASFRLIELMYLSPQSARARAGATYILPPFKEAWNNPTFDIGDPYFGGQPVRRLFADLAPGVPPRFVSPASAMAEAELQLAMTGALDYAKRQSVDDASLRAQITQLLIDAQARVKRQIAHGTFEGKFDD